MKFLTTLEEKDERESTEKSLWVDSVVQKYNQKKHSKKNFLVTWEKIVIRKLFQINHVVLKNHSVNVLVYHLIMLFEFLQVLFFVFYTVEFTNEFSMPQVPSSVQGLNLGNMNFTSATNQSSGFVLPSFNTTTQNSTAMKSTFRIDEYFTFINFQMYTLQNVTIDNFVMIYAIMSGLFYIFLITLFVISTQAFEDSKSEEVKESTKLVLKILTFIMSLILFIFQIPFITILNQAYLCNEDPNLNYTLPNVDCSSTLHLVLVVTTSITIVIYILFLFLQQNLYTSNNFESVLPWSGIERKIVILKVFYKLVLTSSFLFDKGGQNRALEGLIGAILAGLLAYKRYESALMFRRSVYNATLFYEVITSWLQLTMSIRNFADSEVNIFILSCIVLSGIFIAIIVVMMRERMRVSYIETQHIEQFKHAFDFELYFFYMYKVIESGSLQDEAVVKGMIFNHVDNCEDAACKCHKITSSLDRYSAFTKMKQQKVLHDQEEELHQQLIGIEVEAPSDHKDNSHLNVPDGEGVKDTLGGLRRQISNRLSAARNQIKRTATDASQATMVSIAMTERSVKDNHLNILGEHGQEQTKVVRSLSRATTSKSNNNIFQNLVHMGQASLAKKQSIGSNIAGMARSLILITQFFKVEDGEEAPGTDKKSVMRKTYKFFSLLIKDAINKFPKNIDLRMINAFVFKNKLFNEFKAVFELMNCENFSPSLHDQFTIFRRKIEIESNLVKVHLKNIQKIGQLDIIQLYSYERYFMRFQVYEYITVYAAQCFWRELLQKQINAAVLQEKGQEISKNYETIIDLSKNMMKIHPNEIKFLYRYATFLMHIINNEFDALQLFEQAYNVFQSKISKRGMPTNEQGTFGENSASGLIIMTANSTDVGIVIHANNEIEHILGFNRKDLINKNISQIMPRPIAKVHDQFIHRYFETARPTVIDIQRQLLGKRKDGYLRAVDLIVKVYPHLTDKVIFCGFIQRQENFQGIDPVKHEYQGLDQHYIVTDIEGHITNVSESLNNELGLNAKFFNYTDSIFQQMISIEKICPDIFDPDQIELMELEGTKLVIDTRNILTSIDLEQLAAEEIIEVKSSLTQIQGYVQMKKLVLDHRFCTIIIYRLIIIPKNMFTSTAGQNGMAMGAIRHTNLDPFNDSNNNGNANGSVQLGSEDSFGAPSQGSNPNNGIPNLMFQASGAGASIAASSFSSNSSNAQNFNSIIKDFKKALGERKTPANLVLLDRIVLVILLCTIILSSVSFSLERTEINFLGTESLRLLMNQFRNILVVQLASNIRSFINNANGIEFQQYESGTLSTINRFDYLNSLVQAQASQLLSVHKYLTEQRPDSSTDQTSLQSKFEYQNVSLFLLTSNNMINTQLLPYRLAINSYLNSILSINISRLANASINLQPLLLANTPLVNASQVFNQTTLLQKTVYYLLANGYRTMREKSDAAVQYEISNGLLPTNSVPFLIIMILGLIVICISTGVILYQVWIIEQNKAEILSLYALLNMREIYKVFAKSVQYMENLNNDRAVGYKPSENQDDIPAFSASLAATTRASDLIMAGRLLKKKQQKAGDEWNDEMSEEQKEQLYLKEYKHQKNLKKYRDLKEQHKANHELGLTKMNQFNGADVYATLIKRTLEEIRDVNLKDEALQQYMREQFIENKKKQKGYNDPFQNNQDSQDDEEKSKRPQNEQKGEENSKKKKGKLHFKVDDMDKSKKQGKKQGMQQLSLEEDKESRSSNSSSRDNEEKKIKIKDVDNEENKKTKNSIDLSQEELEERKSIFFKTIKTKNWGSIFLQIFIGLIFASYFIQMFVTQIFFQRQLEELQSKVPIYLDRYRNLMLSYAFLRERIINNGSLQGFENDSFYGKNLDIKYYHLSQEAESDLLHLQNTYSKIVSPLVQLTSLTDSTDFCSQVIGNPELYQSASSNKFKATHVSKSMLNDYSKQSFYQSLYDQVILAMQYAEQGNQEGIKFLYSQGVDLSKGDYDRRTAMHIAARYNQVQIIQLLVDMKVKVSPTDRWGSTPMNYAPANSSAFQTLKALGGVLGTVLPKNFTTKIIKALTEAEYKLLFAAQRNDWETIDALWQQGNIINIFDTEGRTALMIAASEGNIQAVQQLIADGADLTLKDVRGNDALADANREQRLAVISYIETVMTDSLVLQDCETFGSGILSNGVQFSIGNFHKRFSDLLIQVNQTSISYKQRMSFLNTFTQSSANTSTIQLYFSAQELYLHRIIDSYIGLMKQTFSNSIADYQSIVQTIFFVFVTIQVIILIILRQKLISILKKDVFQSRGILNLIPDDFFEKNRVMVEKLITKLKN